MLDILRQPWPWYVAGPLIGLVVPFVYWYGGKKWGVSSSLQHLCAAALPGKIEYFRYDWWKKGAWHLAMASGMIVGGVLGGRILSRPDHVVAISDRTHDYLAGLGITDFSGMVPTEVFFFGARYANGCTSGHAISGLSNLQLSSLVVVIGFFIGGLATAHFLLPIIL